MPGITNFPNYFIPQSGKSAVRLTFCHKDSRKNSGATHYSPSDPILPSSFAG